MEGFAGRAESCAAMAVNIAKNGRIKRRDLIAGLRMWATVRLDIGKLVGKWGPRKVGVSVYLILRNEHLAMPVG